MDKRQVILAARLRPSNPREISQGAKSCVVIDGACTTLVNPESGNARAFVLDYSYDSSEPDDMSGRYASNLTIFRDLGLPMLAKALEGVNTCLFTHGQSGSGKTYTMIGQENDPGLMPRLLESLFQACQFMYLFNNIRVLTLCLVLIFSKMQCGLKRS
jgi:hypothetical protein